MRTLLIAAVLVLAAAPSRAASAVSCHCFRERSFDASQPASADRYILATSQNSLLAAVFGVDKKAVVMARMSGASAEDLWIAHSVADKTGIRAENLLEAKRRTGAWKAALAELKADPKRLGLSFREALAGSSPGQALASQVVDEALSKRFGTDRLVLGAARSSGASDAEVIAAVLLSRSSGRPPAELYREVAEGKSTWGRMFNAAGVEPKEIGELIGRTAFSTSPPPAGGG